MIEPGGSGESDIYQDWTIETEQASDQLVEDNLSRNTEPILETKESDNISFDDLKTQLDKLEFNENQLNEICKEENLIGSGGNSDVYSIPGIEKYVLRLDRRAYSADTIGELQEIQDDFPEYNIGQSIAGIPGRGIFFLKKQSGEPAGVPHGKIRREGGEVADNVYAEHLKYAAQMPQEAYDDLISLLNTINDRGYQFDPSKANNILIDLKEERFNFVDINKRSDGSSYRNGVSDIVVALMDNSYAWKYKSSVPLEDYRSVILTKSEIAGNKLGLSLPAKGENSSLDYSFDLAGQER